LEASGGGDFRRMRTRRYLWFVPGVGVHGDWGTRLRV
jgi:hypothetical protein